MKRWWSVAAKVLAGAGAAFVAFELVYRLAFPSQAVVDRLAWEVDQRTGGSYQLRADAARPWRVWGLALEGVSVFHKPEPRRRHRSRRKQAEEDEPAQPVLLARLDRVALQPSLGAALARELGARYALELYGGSAGGNFRLGDEELELSLEAADVDLSRVPIEGDGWNLDLEGLLSLSLELDVDREELDASTGQGELEIEELELLGGKLAGFDLPGDQSFSKAHLEFEVKDGAIELGEAVLEGDPLEGRAEGSITLNKRLSRCRLRLELSFSLADELDKLARLAPSGRDARDDEGVYHFLLSGTLAHPLFRPDRVRAGRGRSHSITARRFRPSALGGEAGKPSPDEEERARLREERIRARRERLKEQREKLEKERREPPPDEELDEEDLPPEEEDYEEEPPPPPEEEPYPPEEPPYPPDEGPYPPDEGDFEGE